MSLVTERRTSWELTGDPSTLRNPANLPYEAVRRAWWSGFQSAMWTVVITVLLIVMIVAIIRDGNDKPNGPRVPREAPEISEPAPSSPGSIPGVGPRVPGNAYDPASDSVSPGVPTSPPSGTLIETPTSDVPSGPLPEFLPGSDSPDRSTPPPIPLSHEARPTDDARNLLIALHAERRIEWVKPTRRICASGRCLGIRG
ncbi:MAG: hypothetical protein R3C59_20760 [Planctomycetaceae bacterium]